MSLDNSQHVDRSHIELMRFCGAVLDEVLRARAKFPDSYGSMCALTEEAGELANAVLDRPWSEVYEEAIQVAAMAARVALERDASLAPIRQRNGLD